MVIRSLFSILPAIGRSDGGIRDNFIGWRPGKRTSAYDAQQDAFAQVPRTRVSTAFPSSRARDRALHFSILISIEHDYEHEQEVGNQGGEHLAMPAPSQPHNNIRVLLEISILRRAHEAELGRRRGYAWFWIIGRELTVRSRYQTDRALCVIPPAVGVRKFFPAVM